MEASHSYRSACPLNQAIEILGDSWSVLIIRDMLFFNKTHYGDFMNSPEGISTNILANRLKHLEEQAIIEKHTDPNDRKRSIYLLTDKGIKLAPVLVELMIWAFEHGVQHARAKNLIDELKNDREATLSPYIEKYRKQKSTTLSTLASALAS